MRHRMQHLVTAPAQAPAIRAPVAQPHGITLGNRARLRRLSRQAGGRESLEPAAESAIREARGGGAALEPRVAREMSAAFNTDFRHVRVHANDRADALNRAVNALAFTTGSDIFFRNGMYSPSTRSGRELLAHELTHVVQQSGTGVSGNLTVGPAGDEYEREADRVASAVVAMEGASQAHVGSSANTPSVQRQETSNPDDAEEQLRQQGYQAKSAGNVSIQRACPSYGGMLIQRRGGTKVGELSVNTNVIAAGLTAGHAWLGYLPTSGKKTTYGTWGNKTPIGLHRDIELGYTPAATRSTDLDSGDYSALTSFATANDDWGYINNCASFAARGWKAVSGESLDYTSGGIPNPSALGSGIVKANGGATGVLPAAPPAKPPPSSSGSSL